MCPSFLATREEKDSTRGRAHVLQDVVNGTLAFDDPAVDEALDLCLSCKGCASDCPTGIDMATYKSEALSQKYRRKLRPRSHYALGQLPRWARMTPPRLANAMLRSKTVGRFAKAAAGVDQRRSLPRFSERPAARLRDDTAGRTPDVWIWADSFTDRFAADTGRAAIELLESMGLRAAVIPDKACCGLTWITTGQLTAARRIVGQAVETLHAYVADGTPVIGLEPSCLAALREDAGQLVDDPRVAEVSGGVRSLAEFLADRVAAGRVDAARPHRGRGRGPAALPPPRRHRLGDRRRPARADRRLGHAGRRLLRAGGQLRGRAGPLRGLACRWPSTTCCPPYGMRERTRLFWLTASRAAPSSTTSPDGGRCTSPSCSIPVLTQPRASR